MRDLDHPDVRRTTVNPLVMVTLVLAMLGAVVLFHPHEVFGSMRNTLGLGPERVLPAPDLPDTQGAYVFAMTQPGASDPVGWDPCEPIRYSINPAGEPAGGRELVERALQRTSAATGLAFEDAGETERRPFTAQFTPFGQEPVVIGWANASQVPELGGQVVGLGGGSTLDDASMDDTSQDRYYVTGGIVLDTDAFTPEAIARSPRIMEALVLHEVAHLVGLGHVGEPMELMFGSNDGQIDYGPGDRVGLAILGSLPCR